jgi:peptide/nickel transport system permease protein
MSVGEALQASAGELATIPRQGRRRVPVTVALGIAFLVVLVVCAAFGTQLAPHDPTTQNLQAILAHPSGAHLLGTDDLGRDVFSRILAGARYALIGPLLIAVGSMLAGGTLGILAGYLGGWMDTAISRWIDLMYSLPSLLIAIVVIGVVGGGYWIGVLVLSVLFIPYNARLVRGLALEQRSRPYVEAARVTGLSRWRIMTRHILPVTMPTIASSTVLNFAFALVSVSGLAFLGMGADPGAAEWGRMLADGIPLVFQNAWAAIAPAVAIAVTAVSVNLVGDWAFAVLDDRGKSR